MDNKKISQFNGHNLVDSELRTQIGEIDFGGKTLVAALEDKASTSALQANKDKIAECERNINAAVTRIDNIIGSAPEPFDTLKEASEWIEAHGADFTALKNSVDNLPDINAMLQSYVTISALTERLRGYATTSEISTTYATKAEVSAVSAKLPEVPAEDGTYTLKATVVSGNVTYSWVKEA